MTERDLWDIVASLTLAEKAALCSGADYWTTKPNPQKNIPQLRMADGPHGLRLENRENEKQTGSHSYPATCFPTAATLACSWSPTLAKEVGAAIAKECLHYNVHMLLGPGVNIKRSPLGGRNFEYYSEDPLLAGELAAGFIEGVQNQGVATSLKHFAVNSQEYKRMSISAEVDDRALFDLYLKPFEIAIRKAKPATVMCSYNRVNGQYASENRRLLTDILRIRFGHAGAVVSDWGAVNNRAAGILAGLDLEMPSSGGANDAMIVQAVQAGQLPMHSLDTACFNLLRLIFSYAKNKPENFSCQFEEHHTLAVNAAAQSAVLLKNDALLPLQMGSSLAVLGQMAQTPRYQGGGSSIVNPQKLVSFTQALQAQNIAFTYSQGYTFGDTTPALLQHARQTAEQAQTVILFLGLPDAYECEGYDRTSLSLPEGHLQLLQTVTQVNPNVCVVLCCGSPVVTPWLPQVKALLCMHLAGQASGQAALQVLFGQVNPCGKLAESWPLQLQHTPCYHHFPMGPRHVSYNESLYVGYRYYASANVPVQFPFGYGLSYTSFAYSNLRLSSGTLSKGQALRVQFTITNTGAVSGKEIAQLYLCRPDNVVWQPLLELKGFESTFLAPGESKDVSINLTYADFEFYFPPCAGNVVEAGHYTIKVGPSSQQLPLSAQLHVQGTQLTPAAPYSAQGPYGAIQNNSFPSKAFAALLPSAVMDNQPVPKGSYKANTTLGEMQGSFWGRQVFRLARAVSRHFIRFSTDPAANRHAADSMAEDLPLRGIVTQTTGRVSPKAITILLGMCNGKSGFWRLVAQLVKRPSYLKNNRNRGV